MGHRPLGAFVLVFEHLGEHGVLPGLGFVHLADGRHLGLADVVGCVEDFERAGAVRLTPPTAWNPSKLCRNCGVADVHMWPMMSR